MSDTKRPAYSNHLVLRWTATLTAPAIALFALYVQFHGEYSPGGGFQAGVILAAAYILSNMLFGFEAAEKLMPFRRMLLIMVGGVMLYALTGVAGMVFGYPYLDYLPFADDPKTARHIGIFVIEVGVGLTVASVMGAVFRAFSHRTGADAKDW